MKFFLSVLLSSFTIVAIGQKSDTTIRYFNKQFDPVQKTAATYAGMVYPDSNKWAVVVINDSSKILMTGYYRDKALKAKDGWFTFFYTNGNPHVRGKYTSNAQDELWMSWYPGGQKKDSLYFRQGFKNGAAAGWFENGSPKYSGYFTLSFADSTWTWYHENGKPSTKEKYNNAGKLTSLECFDTLGNYSGFSCALEKPPTIKGYYGGIYKYIVDSLYYPEEALKKNIQGIVDVSFTITKSGKLENIKIINTPDSLLSNELIRVLKSVPAWYPAIEHNRPYDHTQTLKIPFYKPGNEPFEPEP
jgi:TonB family protein